MSQADVHNPMDCYALCALHIALDPFQRLGGSAPRPGSPEYSSFAAAFTSPSTTISEVPQDAVLSKPAIGTLYGAPYVVSSWCADGENHIVFKNLEGGHPSFLKIVRSPNAKSRQVGLVALLIQHGVTHSMYSELRHQGTSHHSWGGCHPRGSRLHSNSWRLRISCQEHLPRRPMRVGRGGTHRNP